ncbi:MFS transporter [Olivibacter sp. SDN3]|uniref:MFS transporter n=1 Tax=Olivibacter sp. SDN3 TaxID=2764720 RepID=UPI0016510425|nr:MFS transporter [Olivibacter sp. SDN3]QNL50922.1 MFS transporter [Olivibacter sp. SDN3]
MTKNNGSASRIRFLILAFLFINVVINYMDRSNISVAAPILSKELGFSTVELGLIFSAFGWSYTLLQIPGGLLVDRFGPRMLYTFSLISWSVATLLQGFTRTFQVLFSLRLLTGAFEAPAYPINNRIATSWFPNHERATAIGIYTSGQFIGLAFLTPLLMAVQHLAGWRGLFFITGAVGIIWGVLWYVLYRDPQKHPLANDAERAYIQDGGGLINTANTAKKKFRRTDFIQVLSSRKLWGIYLGQFAVNATLWFFLTWFPSYLVTFRGLDFLSSGYLASAPFLAAFIGVVCAGFFSDLLIRKGYSIDIARKTPVIVGLLLSTLIIGANFVDSTFFVILFLALAFFGNGLASITWVFVSTLAPKDLIGLTGGVFNFIGATASIIVPLVIGYLVRDGNFEPALTFVAAMALLGALSYIFLVGRIKATA